MDRYDSNLKIKVYLADPFRMPNRYSTVATDLFTANTQNSRSGLRHNFVVSTTVALFSGQNAYQAAI
jgi:hypothetical protein